MKINKIKEMSSPDLEKELGELKSELFKLRFTKKANGLDNPMKIKEVKKDIARIKTILNERKLNEATSNTKDIFRLAKELLEEMYTNGIAIRLVGMRVDGLIEKNEKQLSLFNSKDTEKQENLDKVVDKLKQKFGYNSITRAGKLHSEKEIKLKDI